VAALDLLHAQALETNKRGALSDAQREGFAAYARSNHRSALSTAAYLVAGAAIVYFFASPRSSLALRGGIIAGCVVLAAIISVRATIGADALTRDLREGRVESTEGAIGRRRQGNGRARATYYLEVGKRSFRVSRGTYDSAPETGYVRVFYLPRSRKIVNIEPLPDPAVPANLSARTMFTSMKEAMLSGDQVRRNEARAELGAIGHAFEAMVDSSPAASSTPAADPRPLAEAIVGTWTSPVVTVTFTANGVVTIRVFGTERRGRWSVDGGGRLQSDVMGQMGTADARVHGNQLTVALDGRTVTLARDERA